MSDMTTELRRTTLEFPDGEYGRIYYDKSQEMYASVTTVLGRRDDPQKEITLQNWRDRNDGVDGRPYHEHINDYALNRGTLLHWYVQTMLAGGLDATDEEQSAIEFIEDHDRDYDFIRSIALNHDSGPHASIQKQFISEDEWESNVESDTTDDPLLLNEILWDDLTWAATIASECFAVLGLVDVPFNAADEMTLDSYYDVHTRRDRIITIEEFVVSDDGYAGQFDLLFETDEDDEDDEDDGRTILCDLKTSKAVYYDYPRQLSAYARAIENSDVYAIETVDEVMILRLQPDQREAVIHYEEDMADGTRYEWFDEFDALNESVQETTTDIDLMALDSVDTSWFSQSASSASVESESAQEVMVDGE